MHDDLANAIAALAHMRDKESSGCVKISHINNT